MRPNAEETLAIFDRIHAYVYALDATLDDDWLDCFNENGVLRYKRSIDANELVIDVHGKPALAEWFSGRAPTGRRRGIPGPLHHFLSAPRVLEFSGDSAQATAYFVRVVRTPEATLDQCMTGRLEMKLARGSNGEWRFDEFMVVDAVD
jgi:hypothetical protein